MFGVGGGITAAGLLVAVMGWGRDGLETASWLAGIAAFFVAFGALILVLPASSSSGGAGGGTATRFRARSGDHSPIIQAGGDITNGGNIANPGDRR